MREPPQADHRSRQRIPVIRCYEHLPPLREIPRLPEVLAAAGYVEPVGSERLDDRHERDRHREPMSWPSRHGDALYEPPLPPAARLEDFEDFEDFDELDTEDTIDVPELGGES